MFGTHLNEFFGDDGTEATISSRYKNRTLKRDDWLNLLAILRSRKFPNEAFGPSGLRRSRTLVFSSG